MLVIIRKTDESVMIGDNIEVTIVDVRDGRVRLGIKTPKNIPVHRRETYDAIKKEKALLAAYNAEKGK